MVTTMNRQVNTEFNGRQEAGATLTAIKKCTIGKKVLKKGDSIRITKSQARRFSLVEKSSFHIRMD